MKKCLTEATCLFSYSGVLNRCSFVSRLSGNHLTFLGVEIVPLECSVVMMSVSTDGRETLEDGNVFGDLLGINDGASSGSWWTVASVVTGELEG